MPHATEGELHAFLDGALDTVEPGAAARLTGHLERCADCRRLLEEEREIRDEASDLLGRALPAVETPPFESVAGAAEAGGGGAGSGTGGSTGPGRTLERFAWAAGVVLALGAGWMGHALLRDAPDAGVLPLASAARQQEPAAEPTPGATAPAPETAASAPAAREVAASETEAMEAGQGDDRLAAADPEAGDRADADAPAPPDADAAAGGGETRAGAALAEDAGRDEAAAQDAVEELAAPAALPLQRLEAPAARFAAAALEWRAADSTEAAEWIGREPLRVPGLRVSGYAVAEDPAAADDTEGGAPGRRFLRVRQRLPGGESLEILHEVSADALVSGGSASEPAAGEGAARNRAVAADVSADESDEARAKAGSVATAVPARVRLPVEGLWITVSAPLAPDSLRALVSRIR